MLESVVTHNFDAVALLRYGRFDESAFLLRKAVEMVQMAGQLPLEHSPEKMRARVASVPLQDLPVSQASSFPLFAKGFILERATFLPNNDEMAPLCASLCLYNLALGVHLKGLARGSASALERAASLYRKVYNILSSYTPSSADSSRAILLAAVVNIIACESELRGPGATATQPWKEVYNQVFSQVTSTSQDLSAMMEQPDELTFFTSSAVFYANQNLSAAPAA